MLGVTGRQAKLRVPNTVIRNVQLFFLQIQLNVVSCSTTGNDIQQPITVEVFHNQIFRCDTASINDVFLPLIGRRLIEVVNNHSKGFRSVAVTERDFVVSIAIEISRPQRVASLKAVVNDGAIP